MKDRIIVLLIIFLPSIIALTLFGLWLYAMIAYGDVPLSEAPIWVYWILTANRK